MTVTAAVGLVCVPPPATCEAACQAPSGRYNRIDEHSVNTDGREQRAIWALGDRGKATSEARLRVFVCNFCFNRRGGALVRSESQLRASRMH